MQLVELQKKSAEFERRNASVLAITAAPLPELERYAKEIGVTFPLLADPKLDVIRKFGVQDPGNRTAWPAVFVIEADGGIAWSSVPKSYTADARATPDALLSELDKLGE